MTDPRAPKVSFVSLGCPKALVDSERIITRLRAEGYELTRKHEGADLAIVNTCGFLESAQAESLEAIGTALAENGKVIVTGCMGAEPEKITERFPNVLAITGPQQYESVVEAVHRAVAAAARSVPRSGPARGHQAHPAALRLSKDFRGLQQPLHLLHHSETARRSGLAAGRRRAARGRAAGRRRREGTAGHLAGHLGLRRRHQIRGEPRGRTARCARSSSISRASWARSASGCGCTTSIPTRMSTRSFR